ncbi:MAG: ABC transporter substrate-binding protein [Pseudomonadota bacterium]
MRWMFTAIAAAIVSISSSFAQERVVSIGGDLTEIIYILGEEDRLVATDTTSVYPPAANQTPKVGYVRQLSAEGVLSVEPDLILISGAAGPDAAVELLEASGVKMVSLPTEYTPASILRKIDVVSEALGAEERGAELRRKVEADIKETEAAIDALSIKPRILFFFGSSGAARSAGVETAAHGVIEMLGGENVFASQIGYKALSLESAVAADPDLILLMAQTAAGLGGVEQVRNHDALKLTSAAQEGRILVVDPVTVMQFGPRTPEAVSALAREANELLSQ